MDFGFVSHHLISGCIPMLAVLLLYFAVLQYLYRLFTSPTMSNRVYPTGTSAVVFHNPETHTPV